jgi:hypothetical protein
MIRGLVLENGKRHNVAESFRGLRTVGCKGINFERDGA